MMMDSGGRVCEFSWNNGQVIGRCRRHLEIMPVTLSAAKGLARGTERSFAPLRMTARTPLRTIHGQSYLQTSQDAVLLYQTEYLLRGFSLSWESRKWALFRSNKPRKYPEANKFTYPIAN